MCADAAAIRLLQEPCGTIRPATNAGRPATSPASSWGRVRRATLANSRTMFDDGRFLRSLVEEAKAEAAKATSRSGHSNAVLNDAPASLLRKMTSAALAREPEVASLQPGFEGGGGVRLHPPHLEDTLNYFEDKFMIESDRRQGEARVHMNVAAPGLGGSQASLLSPKPR